MERIEISRYALSLGIAMFGLSFSELFVIGIVALIVLGPERLPKVARTVGHLTGRAQRYMRDIKSDIQREMDIQELSKLKEDVQSAATQLKNDFERSVAEIKDPLASIKEEMGDKAQQLKQDIVQDLPDLSSLKPTTIDKSSDSSGINIKGSEGISMSSADAQTSTNNTKKLSP